MNNDMYQKYKVMILGELEYRICDMINEHQDVNSKVKFVFSQYVSVLERVRSDYTKMNSGIDLTPEQLEDITGNIGGMHMMYNAKIKGLSPIDILSNIVAGKNIPEDVKEELGDLEDLDIDWPDDYDEYDDYEEDNEDEE